MIFIIAILLRFACQPDGAYTPPPGRRHAADTGSAAVAIGFVPAYHWRRQTRLAKMMSRDAGRKVLNISQHGRVFLGLPLYREIDGHGHCDD